MDSRSVEVVIHRCLIHKMFLTCVWESRGYTPPGLGVVSFFGYGMGYAEFVHDRRYEHEMYASFLV